MKYDFDKVIDRRGTDSAKWDMRSDVLPVWVADMDFPAPPQVVDAIVERAKHGIYGYTIFSDKYYEAIEEWVLKRHNWKIQREWITFSPGVVPGINMLVRALTQPGDKVILQSPVYYPFFAAVERNGSHILNNPLKFENGRYTIDFEDLRKKAKDPRATLLILCSPHNPVGRVWTKEELVELGTICVENGLTVIADEIHCDLVYKQYKHTPFASLADEFAQNSVTCISPSKTFNLAGLQTSVIIIPNPTLRQKFNNVALLQRPNVFGAVALETAYKYGEEWLEQLLDYLKGNLELTKTFIKERIPQLRVIEPEGTYLLWIDCRALGMDPASLEKFMLEEAKIWFDEGYIFGPGGEGFERVNLACPRSILREMLSRLEKAIKNL